jgi:hypothetical protein
MKKYEKISKKYISDIWENMADIWQQNTSRTYGKIWRTYDCHPRGERGASYRIGLH